MLLEELKLWASLRFLRYDSLRYLNLITPTACINFSSGDNVPFLFQAGIHSLFQPPKSKETSVTLRLIYVKAPSAN
jgi:hypothetical protein